MQSSHSAQNFAFLYTWVDSWNLPQPNWQIKNDTLRSWREKTVEQFSSHILEHKLVLKPRSIWYQCPASTSQFFNLAVSLPSSNLAGNQVSKLRSKFWTWKISQWNWCNTNYDQKTWQPSWTCWHESWQKPRNVAWIINVAHVVHGKECCDLFRGHGDGWRERGTWPGWGGGGEFRLME